MVFSSLPFLCIFLPFVFIGHLLLPNIGAKNALLIVASLLFYAYGEPVYVLLMLLSTVLNWGFGCVLGSLSETRARRYVLVAAVIANLLFLGLFKYSAMFLENLNGLFSLGIPVPNIALPIGISFYTFQALSYIIDVYRDQVAPQRNYARVLLYISFFPQLIAGPIVKYHDIEEQLVKRSANVQDIAEGLRRFCVGLGKKVLIANTLGLTVDTIYAAPLSSINIAVAWLAGLAYILQIYFDFSAYSDMAIGMARMFGFRFKENFNYPYASTSIKEFWRRWHISLSTWFKEYLYIPLGGNRYGRGRTVINKLIVFFLCGLWHGAAWTFVVWGLIHGLFLLLEEYLPVHKLPKILGWLYTLFVVTLAFVVFRADSFAQGGFFIQQMLLGFHFEYACNQLFVAQLNPIFIAVFLIACVASQPCTVFVREKVEQAPSSIQSLAQAASYVCALIILVLSMLSLASGSYNPFIYFRF